jgi:hypothetical protein
MGNADYVWEKQRYSAYADWQRASGQERIGEMNVGQAVGAAIVPCGIFPRC